MDEAAAPEVKPKKRRRRRVATGANQYRAYLIKMGAKRIYVDGAEVSFGCLTYWVDNSMVCIPLKRRVEIVTLRPQAVARPTKLRATPTGPDPEEMRQREVRAHEESLRRELEAEMGELT